MVEWNLCGKEVPRSEIVFFSQILIIYTIIAVSIFNLSTSSEQQNLWITLLSSCVGYLLPSPVITKKNVLPNPA